MSRYHRPHRPGATIFFTVGLAARGADTLTREVEALRHAVRMTRAERPFAIAAWVVLPDHLHCVWTLPEGDTDYSTRMGAIKARFSMALRRSGFTPTLPAANPYGAQPGRDRSPTAKRVGVNPDLRKDEAPIWQKRFWDEGLKRVRWTVFRPERAKRIFATTPTFRTTSIIAGTTRSNTALWPIPKTGRFPRITATTRRVCLQAHLLAGLKEEVRNECAPYGSLPSSPVGLTR